MTNYLFYPHLRDGSISMFEAHELASDAEALLRAEAVLLAHVSPLEVVVWDGDRQIGKSIRQIA